MTKIQIKKFDGQTAALESLVNGYHSPVRTLDKIGFVQTFNAKAGETSEIVRFDHHLTLHRKGHLTLASTHEGERQKDKKVFSGCVHFRPAYLPHSSIWNKECRFTVVALHPFFVQTCATDLFKQDVAQVSFRPLIGVQDSMLWELGSCLERTVNNQSNFPAIYAEETATLLSMHLLLTVGSLTINNRAARHALTKMQLKNIDEYIEANIFENIGLNELASITNLSRYYFCRQFKRATGQSPSQYVRFKKMHKAEQLLLESNVSVTEIAALLGYTNISHFSRMFAAVHGVLPSQFRRSTRKQNHSN